MYFRLAVAVVVVIVVADGRYVFFSFSLLIFGCHSLSVAQAPKTSILHLSNQSNNLNTSIKRRQRLHFEHICIYKYSTCTVHIEQIYEPWDGNCSV